MKKQQQDKAILENAPDGAVSCDSEGDYIDEFGLYRWMNRVFDPAVTYKGTRSLDDIRELVALRDELVEKDERIAQLEKDLSTAEKVVLSCDMSFKERDARDLEMQAKGIEDALDRICGNGKTKPYLKDRLLRRAEKLRNHAKEQR